MRVGLSVLSLAVLGAAACGGGAAQGVKAPSVPGAAPVMAAGGSCGRAHAARGVPMPLASPHQGSTVALATQGSTTIAYAADEDDWAIHAVDVDGGREVSSTPLAGRPSQILMLPDGRLVVLLRDKSMVQVLEPTSKIDAPLESRCAVDTAPEPVGVALTPDDATLVVTSGWGRTLAAFDAQMLTKQFDVALGREPRAVVISDDGKLAYVSHAVGAQASKVELKTPEHKVTAIGLRARDPNTAMRQQMIDAQIAAFKKAGQPIPDFVDEEQKDIDAQQGRASCQGFALAKSVDPSGRILFPEVLVDTGDPRQRTAGYGEDNTETEVPDVAVVDSGTGQPIAASLAVPQDVFGGRDPRDTPQECLLPRAAAFDAKTKTLFVSCFGIDQVIAYDGLAASPSRAEKRRWSVAAGPNGIAVDPVKERVVVWSQFDRSLDSFSIAGSMLVDDKGHPDTSVARVDMAPNPARKITVAAALGRLLFHNVGDSRIAKDGRACASCHPDGRDDSLVWATPEGPRRSIMLAGRVSSTAPYSWSGIEKDLKEHVSTTFDRLNGAGGLKSVELDALTAYVQSLTPPPPAQVTDAAKAKRGAEIFASKEAGCSTCHTGREETDNLHHDVKSKTDADKNGNFNTPTLKFIGGTGPYFHDGRYKTLRDLLTSVDDKMGHTKQLSPDDLDALETYLRTL
jgi:DNA-binding beta-propeller fold protein YncE